MTPTPLVLNYHPVLNNTTLGVIQDHAHYRNRVSVRGECPKGKVSGSHTVNNGLYRTAHRLAMKHLVMKTDLGFLAYDPDKIKEGYGFWVAVPPWLADLFLLDADFTEDVQFPSEREVYEGGIELAYIFGGAFRVYRCEDMPGVAVICIGKWSEPPTDLGPMSNYACFYPEL